MQGNLHFSAADGKSCVPTFLVMMGGGYLSKSPKARCWGAWVPPVRNLPLPTLWWATGYWHLTSTEISLEDGHRQRERSPKWNCFRLACAHLPLRVCPWGCPGLNPISPACSRPPTPTSLKKCHWWVSVRSGEAFVCHFGPLTCHLYCIHDYILRASHSTWHTTVAQQTFVNKNCTPGSLVKCAQDAPYFLLLPGRYLRTAESCGLTQASQLHTGNCQGQHMVCLPPISALGGGESSSEAEHTMLPGELCYSSIQHFFSAQPLLRLTGHLVSRQNSPRMAS